MSVLPQELMRKIAAQSRESSENVSSADVCDRRFRELMQVAPIDDRPQDKNLFTLCLEEETEEEKKTDCSSALLAPGPLPIPLSFSDPEENPLSIAPSPQSMPVISGSALSASAAAPHVLSVDLEALFEKMASAMIVMSSAGETETTLFLDNPSSIFYGARITIREFSTAPKAFNIEIASGFAAIACLEAGKQDLLAAFQNGKFNFSVHRFDTHIQSEERPVLHRKENQDMDDDQERRGNP